MSSNLNINTMPRPSPKPNPIPNPIASRSADSDEEEEVDGRMSDSSSSSSSGSSQRSRVSSSSSGSSSSGGSLEEDQDEDEEFSDSGSETEDDTTTCQSDEVELAQLSGRDIFRLPRGLCENSAIFHEFFSMETWQLLPHHVQARLQPLLPNFSSLVSGQAQASAEQQRTLVQLFNGGLQRFGQSPLLQLQRQLEEGNLRPDVLQLRRSIQHSSRREFRFQQAERLSQLAKELFLSREQLLQHAYTSAPPAEGAFGKSLPRQRPRKRKPPTLSMENRFCSQRAKKRYAQELLDCMGECELKVGDISAEEEEEDEECSQLIERLTKTPLEFKLEEPRAPEPAGPGRPSNAADKKCIYNTFFKRRPGVDDEQVLRFMQEERIPQLNDKNFRKYLRDYKRRKVEQPDSPEFDTSEVRLRDICTRAQFVGSFKPGRKPKALMARLNPDPPALVPIGGGTPNRSEFGEEAEPMLLDEPQQVYGRRAPEEDQPEQEHLPSPRETKTMPKKIAPALVPQPVPKLEPLNGPIANSSPSPTLPHNLSSNPPAAAASPTAGHITGSPTREVLIRPPASPRPASFFSLLRDLFVSTPQHRLTYGELQILLSSWREINSDSVIPTGDWQRSVPDWSKLLQSAINFLSGDFGSLPPEYVPYIEHKTQLGIYQWIGAGRDSDTRLQGLCHSWLRSQREEQSQLSPVLNSNAYLNLVDASPTPPPRCPTTWTVRTASQAEILEFQRQERIRFEYPHRPFTYRLNGYESVVGPVKGIYTQSLPLNKARGHAVMVDDRPPFVTILTLVRDATARLPNGEGTRAEISELLKCSQYVSQQAADNVLQTIVSGALDRMHGGQDPCVKYDARRKIWIYLHRNRSEAEFERMHRQNQSLVKQKQQQRKQLARPKNADGSEGSGVLLDVHPQPEQLPALVPAVVSPVQVPTVSVVQVKKPMGVKCPPVPPLKYHIPPGATGSVGTIVAASSLTNPNPNPNPLQQVQKSLLKPVALPIPAPTTVQRPVATAKAGNFAISKISPTRNTTPILVSTPSGFQTVHVATTPNQSLGSVPPVVTKKLTIKKPTPNSKIGNFIIPMEQQQQPQQQQQQQQQQVQLQVQPVAGKPKALTITPRPQMPKNIIRLLPAVGGTTIAGNPTVTSSKPSSVQILGPRVMPQSQTVRPVQQKIGAVSIVASKPVTSISATEASNPVPITTTTSSPVTGGGTIVKMSPQAFASLQQQQLKQVKVNSSVSPVQSSPQQRIIVGNTAISSNKKIVFQALPKSGPKILATSPSSPVVKSATTSVSPQQQQRIVLQNFKQPGVATNQTGAATRVIRATPATAAVGTAGNATQGTGHIITLDSLQSKPAGGGKLLTSAGNNIIHLANSSAGNVITLSPNQPTKQMPTMARIVSATATTTVGGGGPGGTTIMPKIIGKTTVLPGKPLLVHAKQLKQLGGNSVAITQTTTTATTTVASAGAASGAVVSGAGVTANAVRTTQNIVIGGQTMKLQGAIPARPAGSTPVQTVIMGNQLLRLATSSSSNNSVTTSSGGGITTAPKTLLIGAGGTQTLRLAKNMLVANKQITSTATTTASPAATTATAGNNLVFAVQGNGGQLYFSPGLQGLNLKPLSSLKVIPMASAAGASSGGKISVTTVAGGEATGKALATKLIPATVLKTATGSGN
ncbi:LOW QUALITY PROTEIN: nuclear factor related to kappa-B-binding protein [Drosophila serrata]|uniref:LOW QUALITY PROTEIN: nuclear factor related to kappa-B-binding protein n=1 Tax=Drosophila serrata TaxID=7274 RepID=UPI000A1D0923|nr:LOW QUALITY PROTEIN: nuclear factor related to kappa-B-binding protein [Drosophila serrata]